MKTTYYEAVPVAGFTPEEVTTARAVRDSIKLGGMPDSLKSIYMAGEICMWDELQLREVSTLPEPGKVSEILEMIDEEMAKATNLYRETSEPTVAYANSIVMKAFKSLRSRITGKTETK